MRFVLVAAAAVFGTAGSAQHVYTSAPHVPIPNLDPTGVGDVITVPPGDAGTATDVDVAFEATHTWTGDLVVTLTHPLGPTITLMDRPGVPATTFGCSGDDPQIVTDDEGRDGTVEDDCMNAGPAYLAGGHYVPDEALDAFDGLPAAGDWTLTMIDPAGGGDIGTFERWTLAVEGLVTVGVVPAVPAPSGTLTVRPNPVRGAGHLVLTLRRPEHVLVALYDALGRPVVTVHTGLVAAGTHLLPLDVAALPSGVYAYRAVGETFGAAGRMTVLR